MPVFISHSHQDKEFVDLLAAHLIKQNAIGSRHARLAIHAAHTVSSYVLEFMEVS